METRFREARLKKGLKAVEVAGLIEVTKVTLSTWENGQKLPSYENLIKLADLYDCSIDYLLGRAEATNGMPAGSKEIDVNTINIYHGRPVWSSKVGWLLVNGVEKTLIAGDGTKYQYEDAGILYTVPVNYSVSSLPNSNPLNLQQIVSEKSVWVEPISPDRTLADKLRGIYHLIGAAVVNEYGQKFYLDNLGKDWIAFKNNN